ncbi:Inositol 1,4,5-trisphosphate receptor type 2 [Nowakowskiella sp. JEL0078]|nr:Inositol 1,4,5-trisphosphate receptor type 2 [Nowakowskiella sp. JEL0078]
MEDNLENNTLDAQYPESQDLMRLLQLLVEGHNLSLQNYVRHQPDNVKSFDLVKDVVEYLQAIIPIMCYTNLELITQGCTPNQVNIFNSKIIQPINHILRDTRTNIAEVKGHSILCMLSLMEDDSDDETVGVMRETTSTLDLEALLSNLTSVYTEINELSKYRKSPNLQNEKEVEQLKESGFLLTMLIITLMPMMKEDQYLKCSKSSAFIKFSENIGRIEIVRETPGANEKRLHSVLFPIPNICKLLRKDSKKRFLWQKKRPSPQEKVQDFVQQSEDMYFEIRNQARIANNKALTILANYFKTWWQSAFALTLLLNIMNLWSMQIVDDGTNTFTFGHLIFWCLSSAELFVIQFPLFFNRRMLAKYLKEKIQLKKNTNCWSIKSKHNGRLIAGSSNKDTSKASEDDRFEVTSTTFDILQTTNQKENFTTFVKTFSSIAKCIDLTFAFLEEPRVIYHICMVVSSFLGNTWDSSFFAIHLLDFIYRDEVLQGVIQSVTLNWSSLSKTGVLGVIIVYIYSTFVRPGKRTRLVRAGGGVGDLLNAPKEQFGARIVLDISFFLIVIVFLLNVIFGIIFDTFGQLREENQSIQDDLKSTCFICSINASEFERHAEGFQVHTKYDHNIWHYLYFLVHLKMKDPTEYTSHESYVSEMLDHQDLGFFPINRAICLKHRDSDEDIEKKLKRILDEKQNEQFQTHPYNNFQQFSFGNGSINSTNNWRGSINNNNNKFLGTNGPIANIKQEKIINTIKKSRSTENMKRRHTIHNEKGPLLNSISSLKLPEGWEHRETSL